jgi:probable phosphoglycerate mutase
VEGTAQAARLATALAASTAMSAIYTSPLDRARDTAHALARYQPVVVREDEALTEIDFGEWTGWSFADLDKDPAWQRFNRARAGAVIPGGEHPAEAQRRMVACIARLAARHRGQAIALVSHAEPIRCALLHYQRLSLDQWDRIEVAPASVSQVLVSAEAARVVTINGVEADAASPCPRS